MPQTLKSRADTHSSNIWNNSKTKPNCVHCSESLPGTARESPHHSRSCWTGASTCNDNTVADGMELCAAFTNGSCSAICPSEKRVHRSAADPRRPPCHHAMRWFSGGENGVLRRYIGRTWSTRNRQNSHSPIAFSGYVARTWEKKKVVELEQCRRYFKVVCWAFMSHSLHPPRAPSGLLSGSPVAFPVGLCSLCHHRGFDCCIHC